MTEPEQSKEQGEIKTDGAAGSPSTTPHKNRVLTAAIPLLFLALAYVALFSRYHLFSPRDQRIVLTQEQSQRLADRSKSLMDEGRYSDALAPTLTLSQAYPDNHIYLGHLADIYDHLGRYSDEASAWEKYMNRAPVPVEACPKIGQAYWKQGDKFEAQAVAAYQRCLALDPSNTDSIFYLAHALEMSNQWPQAADYYQKGLAISPDYTDLALGLARCWVRLDKLDDAQRFALQVLSKHPDSPGAFLVLGMVDLHQENYAGAKKQLTHGVELSDSDPDFHFLLARVAEDTNDTAEELRQYNRLVELRPDDAQIRSRRDALAAQTASK
jgi:tetratricopeptide (TPR) repeat protein